MTSPAETTGDNQMMPDDNQMMPDDNPAARHMLTSDPADATVEDDVQSPTPVAWGHPVDDNANAAEEPGASGRADAEILSLVVTPGAEFEPAGSTPAANDPKDVPAVAPPASNGSTSPAARWPDIQAMFVDDPRSAVERAAGLAGDCAEALVLSVQERQRALMSAWQGDDTGTEELRVALRDYRAFWNHLEEFPREP
jgi:hypothetical protein